MKLLSLGVTATLAAASVASGQSLTVRFTNNQPAGGFSTSPVWIGMHNGTFDYFNAGGSASAATEALAELGNGAGLTTALGASGVAGMITTDVANPQFTPGETSTTIINVPNPATQRWFSFASMVVPSNDFFIGNDNPLAHQVFDSAGQFLGPLTIQIFGMNTWHAGTEVNDVNLGIAFLVGRDPAAGTPEALTIQPVFSQATNTSYLNSIVGMQTPVYTVSDVLTSGELLATIQIIPTPTTGWLMLIGAGLWRQRTRSRCGPSAR
jgi:hypothetical protein